MRYTMGDGDTFAVVSEAIELNSTIDSLSPVMMALRCLATPMPDRYIDSAFASAAFTLMICGSKHRRKTRRRDG